MSYLDSREFKLFLLLLKLKIVLALCWPYTWFLCFYSYSFCFQCHTYTNCCYLGFLHVTPEAILSSSSFFFLHNSSWSLIFQFHLFSMYLGLNTTITWSSSLASHPQILYWLNSLTSNVGGLQSLDFDKSCLCTYLRLFHPVKLLSLDLFSELQACITNCLIHITELCW